MQAAATRKFAPIIALIAAGAVGLGWGTARADESPPVFPFPIEKTVLDNGLTVMSIPFDSPGIISYYTLVRTGSRNEVEKGLSGFAHFFEHMMFRGTDKYPQEAYNAVLKSVGADSNASTSDDWTIYYMTIPASALGKAVEVESDRFQNLKYDEPSFQKEARAVLGEYNKSASSPFLKLYESLQDNAYSTHTYKHTTIGFLADIKDMPNQFAYSKVFFDRWYRPENCTVIVAGDVKHGELVKLAEQGYGGWKRGSANVEIPTEPPQSERRTAKLTWPVPTLNTVLLGYHIPATDPKNPDVAALDALAQAVFGETSPLHQELVLKEQKAVMLAAEAEPKRDPGLFTILSRARNSEDLAVVRKRIREALEAAAKTPIDEDRLQDIKSHLRYEFATTLTTPNNVARVVGLTISVAGRAEAMNELYAAYDRLTPADLQRVAAKYFVPSNETEITLESEVKK